MTAAENIAWIRENYWHGTPSTDRILALCDDYEALAAAARDAWTPCDVRELNGPRRGWCMAHNQYLRSDGCSMANLGALLGEAP